MHPKVSLFASAVRPKLWPALFKSLEGTRVSHEIIFCGNSNIDFNNLDLMLCNIKYIKTENIKPAQCYEIARRNCSGEVVIWIADDCEFPNDVIGKSYNYWKSQDNEKLILSIQTKESGYNLPQGQLFDMNVHRFFGGRRNTPLMAPIGLMSRRFLNEIKGLDKRYVCGQYENDIVMRAYNEGAKVEIFGDKDCYIDIDHLGKSIAIGESKTQSEFLKRPFAKGYNKDREILEKSWSPNGSLQGILSLKNGMPIYIRTDDFEPYEDRDILTKSQSNNLPEMWQ